MAVNIQANLYNTTNTTNMNTNTSVNTDAAANNSNATGSMSANGNVQVTPPATNNSASAVQNALQNIKQMLAGDILTGYVSSVNEDNIILQLNNGQSITARIAGNVDVAQGQNLTFMINKNAGNTIELKPVLAAAQENLFINKVLGTSGFPVTENNINIVKELLSLNMPVDMDTISEMIQNNMKYPDASLNTIASLINLDIPITEDSIMQFEAYKNYEHSIMGELSNLSGDLISMTSDILDKGGLEQGVDFLQNAMNTLYGVNNGTEQTALPANDAAMNNANTQNEANVSQPINSYISEEDMTGLNNKLTAAFGENANELKSAMANGDITNKEVLDTINNLLKQSQNPTAANELLNSKEYGTLLKQMVNETMMLPPAQVAEANGIKNFYKKLRNNVEGLLKAAEKEAPESALAKNMNEVKSNIDFMNDLNKNMTYIQMPVKFSESAGNGDLYVFTNKKALENGTDNISALLHLDMDNLGPVDIYVKLAGMNLSTNFCLESEEMLDFVYSHIETLNKRLEALGYNTRFEMKLSEDQNNGIDFVEDFIQKDNHPVKISQFVFDAKV